MAIDWINDDLTFAEGFEQNLPAEIRDYAKDAKDLPALLKRGVDTQRDLHSRIKIPDTPEGKREVLNKHFKDVLDADEQARQAAADKAAKEAARTAETEALETAKKKADKAAKDLKEKHGAKFEPNLELVRRAFRSDYPPPWIKEAVAKVAGVELDKITDEQIKQIVMTDPAVFETLLAIGNLTKDGRMEHGDGGSKKSDECEPRQPNSPELYIGLPPGDPVRKWFENREWDMSGAVPAKMAK